MPRKLFKRWSPDPDKIRKAPGLQFLGKILHDPNLFHLNRHSVSVAVFWGLFICFLPMPGQLIMAAVVSIIFHCNLPITFALVWISNPLTFPFIFFVAYRLGVRLLGIEDGSFSFELSWHWLTTGFLHIWQPLVLGSLTMSLFFSCLGYITVQWMWRWHVLDRWQKRREKRQAKKNQT